MKHNIKETATRRWSYTCRKSIQVAIRRESAQPKMQFGTKHDRLEYTASLKWWKSISEEASLSKVYTNHCVRATAITLWSNAGISNRHIMAILGHRSQQSLVSYNSRPSTSQLHNCSQVLSRAFSSSINNHSQPSEVSQQTMSFQTKQVATKSLFGDCSIQKLQIVFNSSSSEIESSFKWHLRTVFYFRRTLRPWFSNCND